MPLVQSLDILRQRLSNPVFKAVLDDVHEKVRGGAALSDAFGAHADLFSGVYTASLVAGERSGSLDTVLRRFVAYSKVIDTVRRKTLSALLYPAILVALAVGAGGDHRRQGRAGVLGLLLELQPGAAARHPGHRRGLGLRPRATSGCCSALTGRRGVGLHVVGAAAGPAGALRPLAPAPAGARADRPQVRHLADRAHAGRADRRRHPAGQRPRHRRDLDQQPLPRRRAADRRRPRPRGPRLRRDAARAPGAARRRHQDDRGGGVDRRRCTRC